MNHPILEPRQSAALRADPQFAVRADGQRAYIPRQHAAPRAEPFQLVVLEADQSAIRADPECAGRGFGERGHGFTVLGEIKLADKRVALESEQAAAPGARPDAPGGVFQHRPDVRVGEAGVEIKMRPHIGLHPVNARTFRRRPDLARAGPGDGLHRAALPVIGRADDSNFARTQHDEAAAGADPDVLFAIFSETANPVLRQTVGTVEIGPALGRVVDEQPTIQSADQQLSRR